MTLTLARSVVFFDLETTGVNVGKDRIVEFSGLKVNPDGSEETLTLLVHPEMPIPADSAAIHGITDEKIKDSPKFGEVAQEVVTFMDNADLGGFNSNKFDIPMLMEELARVGVDMSMKGRRCIDVQNIFHKLEQRTLVAAYKFYCQKDLTNAHSAEADTRATYEVFRAQIDKYEELKDDMDFLHEFSSRHKAVDFSGHIIYNQEGVECFNFGKFKGKPVLEILKQQPSYYNWMMDADFPSYTKKVLTEIRLRGFNQ